MKKIYFSGRGSAWRKRSLDGLRVYNKIGYKTLVLNSPEKDYNLVANYLADTLPDIWDRAYRTMTSNSTNVLCFRKLGFEYIYDNCSMVVQQDATMYGLPIEDRLVAVHGWSSVPKIKREVERIRGWVGPTEKFYGKTRDKGHFIAHSIGGLVDGFEQNLFWQDRRLNRGWSKEGKLFRKMERYCKEYVGTYLFVRPIYADSTSIPSILEYGVLMKDGNLWVEHFAN